MLFKIKKFKCTTSKDKKYNIFYSAVTVAFGIVSFLIRKPVDEKVSITIMPKKMEFVYKF